VHKAQKKKEEEFKRKAGKKAPRRRRKEVYFDSAGERAASTAAKAAKRASAPAGADEDEGESFASSSAGPSGAQAPQMRKVLSNRISRVLVMRRKSADAEAAAAYAPSRRGSRRRSELINNIATVWGVTSLTTRRPRSSSPGARTSRWSGWGSPRRHSSAASPERDSRRGSSAPRERSGSGSVGRDRSGSVDMAI
jgi:hypothetical protein